MGWKTNGGNSGGGGSQIDDTSTSLSSTWSSKKIDEIKANTEHDHNTSDIDNLESYVQDIIDKTPTSPLEHEHDWSEINNRPTSTPLQIDQSVSKTHEHINKQIIDQLEDADGNLLYRGNSLTGYSISVETIGDRNNIPLEIRVEGMICLVREDGSMYYLKGGIDNAFWQIFSVGAGGATNASTLSATPPGNLTGSNAQSLIDELEAKKVDIDDIYTKVETDNKLANLKVDYSTLLNKPDVSNLHSHENAATLNKFNEFRGDLTWNGKTIGNMINDYYDNDGDGLVDKAATLEGLISTIKELNFSTGLTGNIQSQLNSLSSGVTQKGEFTTYADMIVQLLSPTKGDWVFIKQDETKNNARTQYYHDGTEWIYGGGATEISDATPDTIGGIRLGGVLSNPNSTANAPLLTNTGVVAGTYKSANLLIGSDGRIINAEEGSTVFINDDIVSSDETWSSEKMNTLVQQKANKNHDHSQLHDANMLGTVRLNEVNIKNKYVPTYNSVTGQAEWQRQQGGKVFIGSKFIEGDYTLKAGSYINLFVDDVTKEITINSTFRDGVNNGVPTLTEITESITVPAGQTVRFSSNAGFNKYEVKVVKVRNSENVTMELCIYDQAENGEIEYLSNREYNTHDITTIPIADNDQTKKIHLSLSNYGIKDTIATVRIKTTNLI